MYVGTSRRGLGANPAQVVGTVSSLGTPVASAVGGTAAAGALGISASLAVPLVGAALAGITFAVIKLIQNSGCGVTCVETSQWANQAEPLLRQNLDAYFALPKPRAQSAQAAALANFDAIWAQLQKLCSQPGTGNAGKRCISDRQAGACTWKQTATYSADIMAAGEPQIGQCWSWFSGYRDPIQNDPNVAPDSQAASAAGNSLLLGGSTISPWALAGLAALIIAGVWLA